MDATDPRNNPDVERIEDIAETAVEHADEEAEQEERPSPDGEASVPPVQDEP
ncbi:hypothetical protein [Corynebacterium nasicanis]|uniref:Uncharacterized protein n=1 Tax=Corynebacterium nasicanis TaxID=1448267 RepID=A0ABW1QCM9_9CORY